LRWRPGEGPDQGQDPAEGIYRDLGDGIFATPIKVSAGNEPSGFSVSTINGQLALLVGNAFGDILTLLYDVHGGFAPDRANMQNAPLAVGTIAATGQQFVVVADQSDDQAALYYRIPNTDSFGAPTSDRMLLKVPPMDVATPVCRFTEITPPPLPE
jgi:hypothetical protein